MVEAKRNFYWILGGKGEISLDMLQENQEKKIILVCANLYISIKCRIRSLVKYLTCALLWFTLAYQDL